jgi:hypothetical protein
MVVGSTTICDKVCQLLATGRWFSSVPPASSTNITDRPLKYPENTTSLSQVTDKLYHLLLYLMNINILIRIYSLSIGNAIYIYFNFFSINSSEEMWLEKNTCVEYYLSIKRMCSLFAFFCFFVFFCYHIRIFLFFTHLSGSLLLNINCKPHVRAMQQTLIVKTMIFWRKIVIFHTKYP